MGDFFVQECCVQGTDLENHGPTLILCDDPLPIDSTVDGAGLNYKICLALNSFGDLSRQCSPHSGETGIYLAAYTRAVNKPSAKFSQSL